MATSAPSTTTSNETPNGAQPAPPSPEPLPPPLQQLTGQPALAMTGMRLDQLMLLVTIGLVVATVTMSGALQALATQSEFAQSVALQRNRLEEQARSVGRSVAQVVALSSTPALRDNDHAFLTNIVGAVARADANIQRVRIADISGRRLADTANDPDPPPDVPDHQWVEITYRDQPALVYRESIVYDGKPIGAVVLTYSLASLRQEIDRLETARKTAQRRILVRTAALALVFILVGSVLAALQSRRITKPLSALTLKAMRVAQGDFTARVQQTKSAGQEVNMLSQVFNYMADRVKALLLDAKVRAQLDQQMQVARAVQESLLPPRDLITMGPLRVAGLVVSADRCGGDFWALSQLEETRVAVCLGDVTGHGLSTALVAAAACSAFHYGTGFTELDTYQMVLRLNRTLYQTANGSHQMTCALAMIDLSSGKLELTNAAHPFPFIFNRVTKSLRSLVAKGPRLGESLQSVFLPYHTTLEPGDIILCYSDGVIEAEDPSGQPYAAKRLRNCFAANGDKPVNEIRDAILADVIQHCRDKREDDMTVLVIEYRPSAA